MAEPYAKVLPIVAEPPMLFDREGLIVPNLGRLVRAEGHVRVGADGLLWRYVGGVYRPDGDMFVRHRVRERLGSKFKRRHTDEVLAWLRSDFASIGGKPPEDRLNVSNGLLNWRTLELEPHAPEFLSVNQLPVEWKPDARCPAIDAFLASVLPDTATVRTVLEIIGYATYVGNPLRKAILMLGPGANGKSVLLDVIVSLLGAANVSAVPLQVLTENRFAAAELFGKLANVCGDLDARSVTRSDSFKMLTGGDPMLAERKHRDHFTFHPYCLPIFSANEPPLTSDQTAAYFDRWLVVPMTRRIAESEQDPHLRAKLTTPAELEGLLVRAVHGLRDLLARGRFDAPDAVRAAGEGYRERLDTARGFVTDCCVLHANAWTARTPLYNAYRRWCEENNRRALASHGFFDHLRSRPELDEKIRTGVRGFSGIGLAEEHRA